METVNSFKGYDKVDVVEEAAFKKKTRRRVCILSVSFILLLALIAGVVSGILIHHKNSRDSGGIPTSSSPSSAIKTVCSVTRYPDSCIASLTNANSSDPIRIFRYSLTVASDALGKIASVPEKYAANSADPLAKEAARVCVEVLNDAVDLLSDAASSMDDGEKLILTPRVNDLRTWLSAVITHQETCLDALDDANASFAGEIRGLMKNSAEFASNSLSIVSKLLSLLGNFKIPSGRRLLAAATAEEDRSGDFPAWLSAADRRMLQGATPLPRPNVTVAKDGSGDVRTVNEAVRRIPKKSKWRFAIYVKAGEYVENVVLDKSHWNVMLYGDGMNATVISGSKNFVDGTPTFSTATFAVAGKAFIARDIKVMNTAGAVKHQAVALRSGSDLSVFYRCSFDGFQDTLYAHSNRQFYGDCIITGTIDFIFGNSAVVFQNCQIMPRQPLSNQFITVTAQGKKDPEQNTGISIDRCVLSPLDNLTAASYLGRPWKNYSTTVVMRSNITGFLNPAGWFTWVPKVEPEATIFYGEYQNTGPGASTANRVKWAGYRPSLTAAQASRFNVESFIQGSSFLPEANVVYNAN